MDEKANGRQKAREDYAHELYLRRNPAKIAGGEGGKEKGTVGTVGNVPRSQVP